MRVTKLSRVLTLAVMFFAIAGSVQANSGNETIATASSLDWSLTIANSASASGMITPYDVDFYQLQVYQGGTVEFTLQPVTGGIALQSPRIDLFDPSDTQITGKGGTSLDFSLDPGIYYPRISSGDAGSGFGLYSLTVNGANSESSATAQIGAIDPAPEPSTLIALCIGCAWLGVSLLRRRFKLRA